MKAGGDGLNRKSAILLPLLLEPAWPVAAAWLRWTVARHRARARPVGSWNFPGLTRHFPRDFLETSYAVVVEDSVPLPPGIARYGARFGFPFAPDDILAITYLDTYFVRREWADEEHLHLHELIHVAQWRQLGARRFLKRYAFENLRHGYRDAPLEAMAFDLEARFVAGENLPRDLCKEVALLLG